MPNETTLEKVQGAKGLELMFLWSGMTQKEIMTLEDTLHNAIDDNRSMGEGPSDGPSRRDLDTELCQIRGQASDAGVHIWRHGYPEQKDYRAPVNHWQPDMSEREGE